MRSQEEMSEARSLDQREEEEEFSTGVDGGDVEEGSSTEEFSFFTGRRIAQTLVVVLLLVAGIYLLFPSLIGLEDALAMLDEAKPGWLAIALGFGVAMFATYVALFRGVVGGDVLPLTWREAFQINMAGLAATRLFSAGGAGGIVLTYWALRKAGMDTRRSTQRMVAFLALQYAFYPLAVIVFGVLLRTGVMSGSSAIELTIIPAAIAGIVIFVGLTVALIPRDLERRIANWAEGHRRVGLARRLARGPEALADGLRKAIDLFSHPKRGGLAVLGATGFWATQIAILWASFRAFDVSVPLAVLVQGFFLGMVANLIPFAPAGVGAVDAGLIGAFVLFGLPESTVFAAVLIYRLVAFWLPLPPGIVAFFALRRTVQDWEVQGKPIDRVPAASFTSV
jgi:uncharacterized protein (TIRG00374 family)